MKEKITETIKLFLLTFMMVLGFWFAYMFIWFAVGLPQENWALWLMFGLALASEYVYVRWVIDG